MLKTKEDFKSLARLGVMLNPTPESAMESAFAWQQRHCALRIRLLLQSGQSRRPHARALLEVCPGPARQRRA